jgi:cytochrome c biogenesis protein CcdA
VLLGLMIVLVAVGVMNVAVMAALAVVIFVEKLWRYGKPFAQVVGVALLAVGPGHLVPVAPSWPARFRHAGCVAHAKARRVTEQSIGSWQVSELGQSCAGGMYLALSAVGPVVEVSGEGGMTSASYLPAQRRVGRSQLTTV